MDDTDKTQGQTGQVPNQQPQGSVGTLVKERELPVASSADSSVSEFIEPSGAEREIEVHPKLKEMGVKPAAPEFPKVGPSQQKIGISPSGESVPVLTQTSRLIQLHKELEIEKADKQGTGNAVRWLWELLSKVFKQPK